jgi:hypothetical protein
MRIYFYLQRATEPPTICLSMFLSTLYWLQPANWVAQSPGPGELRQTSGIYYLSTLYRWFVRTEELFTAATSLANYYLNNNSLEGQEVGRVKCNTHRLH